MRRVAAIQISFLLILLSLGAVSCGIKFDADARQAAENIDKNQPKSKFVDVDNTKVDPKPKKAINLAKLPNGKKVSEKTDLKKEEPARYVRVGKNRRLRVISTGDVPSKDIPNSSGTQKQSLHQKLVKHVKATHRKIVAKVMGSPIQKKGVLYPRVQLHGARMGGASWVLKTTELECSITQTIPNLGGAIFKYNSVRGLKFIFSVNHPIARKLGLEDKRYSSLLLTDKYPYPHVGARVESIPPSWKPFAIKKVLGFIPFKEGYEPFVLPHRQRLPAMFDDVQTKRKMLKGQLQVASINKTYLPEIWPDRLIYELVEGMNIRLTYRDWTDGTEDIIATISPINFSKVKRDFEKCISGRPKYDFKKFIKTKLHFTKGQKSLSKKMRTQLRNMVKFVKFDEEIKKVIIKSYTDSTGFKRINRNAAKIQAQAIKRYMKKLGMEVKITAIGIGEGPYVGSNRSRAGRAQNRRSIISLIK